jgi:UDPglucose--hexose-1-phosphate uridylyltransferase
LLEEWVLCSPQRLDRPWQGREEPDPPPALPSYEPSCYLCPGNQRANRRRNPRYTGTFAFDNDFPALLALEPPAVAPAASAPPLRWMPAAGVCRVVCFSPRHDLPLARMSSGAREAVVDAWCEETVALAARPEIAYVQLFENNGSMMGCSNPHPHCQIWGTDHVPTIPARLRVAQERHLRAHGADLLGAYLTEELAGGDRLVCQNQAWVALVPFWAVWPFETVVVPRRRVTSFGELELDQRQALAALLGELHTRYDNLFRTPFPYSVGWHPSPCDGASDAGWRLHATYHPPLLRSARVRKFLVGYELNAEPQRDLTAEAAAAALRSQSTHHYLGDGYG